MGKRATSSAGAPRAKIVKSAESPMESGSVNAELQAFLAACDATIKGYFGTALGEPATAACGLQPFDRSWRCPAWLPMAASGSRAWWNISSASRLGPT